MPRYKITFVCTVEYDYTAEAADKDTALAQAEEDFHGDHPKLSYDSAVIKQVSRSSK